VRIYAFFIVVVGKGILRPSHVCFICGTLPTGTLTVCIPNLFPPKEKHNVGLLRFDDDHDHICYRFAQVRIFGGKSNVFKSLQGSRKPLGASIFKITKPWEFVDRVRVESQSYAGVNRKNTLGESIFKVRVRSGRTVEIR
jgi:hypothetical protein